MAYVATAHDHLRTHTGVSHWGWALRYGLGGGVVAGLTFGILQLLSAWLATGDLLLPLRVMASIPMTDPAQFVSTGSALVVGTLTFFAYAIVAAIVIAAIVALLPTLHDTRARIVALTSVAGFALWLLNYYVFAPIFDTQWFANGASAFQQFLWHTFFFGSVLGYYLDMNPPKDTIAKAAHA